MNFQKEESDQESESDKENKLDNENKVDNEINKENKNVDNKSAETTEHVNIFY